MIKSKKDKRLKTRLAIRKKVSGTSERPRLAVFRSNKEIYVASGGDGWGIMMSILVGEILYKISNKA